jgi:hypothetical protein
MHRWAHQVSRFATRARVFAAVVTTAAAWLVVLSQLTTALHFALISHEICAAHGELVHGSSLAPTHPRAEGSATALPGGDKDCHEHCPVLSRRFEHTAVLDAPGVRLPPLALDSRAASFSPEAVVASRSELLLAAPKQSPPS